MSEKREPVSRQAYLKVALIFFAFWLFLAYVIFENIRELGGMSGLIDAIRGGDYSDLILVVLSIFLLAKFIQSVFRFFSFDDQQN